VRSGKKSSYRPVFIQDMTGLNNRFIKGRQSIIVRVTGMNTNQVLNASRINLPIFSGRDAAAGIKIAFDQFNPATMDKNRKRVAVLAQR